MLVGRVGYPRRVHPRRLFFMHPSATQSSQASRPVHRVWVSLEEGLHVKVKRDDHHEGASRKGSMYLHSRYFGLERVAVSILYWYLDFLGASGGRHKAQRCLPALRVQTAQSWSYCPIYVL